jgi:hypothetical protein
MDQTSQENQSDSKQDQNKPKPDSMAGVLKETTDIDQYKINDPVKLTQLKNAIMNMNLEQKKLVMTNLAKIKNINPQDKHYRCVGKIEFQSLVEEQKKRQKMEEEFLKEMQNKEVDISTI